MEGHPMVTFSDSAGRMISWPSFVELRVLRGASLTGTDEVDHEGHEVPRREEELSPEIVLQRMRLTSFHVRRDQRCSSVSTETPPGRGCQICSFS